MLERLDDAFGAACEGACLGIGVIGDCAFLTTDFAALFPVEDNPALTAFGIGVLSGRLLPNSALRDSTNVGTLEGFLVLEFHVGLAWDGRRGLDDNIYEAFASIS
jgi:hypothetical protein